MNISISQSKLELGQKAAAIGAEFIRNAINENGQANIIVATGASQFEMLSMLTKEDIDWSKVTGFHLDEYIGLPDTHPASFRKYLKERFVEVVEPGHFHYVNGDENPEQECTRLNQLIGQYQIDAAFVGIGENGHLAFNDPPADFDITDPFIIVELDQACRTQQLNEGWFGSLSEVPHHAISMSIHQIMKSSNIVCSVPDERKATAVSNSLTGSITPEVPASILQSHPSTYFFLDQHSAAGVSNNH